MKRYIERNFNGNMKGNLYELEHHDDFVARALGLHRGGVAFRIREQGRPEVRRSIASPRMAWPGRRRWWIWISSSSCTRWSSFSSTGTVTPTTPTTRYLYNDVNAVAVPGENDVKFKMIPWGIDQTLQPRSRFELAPRRDRSRSFVRNDAARRAQVIDQIRDLPGHRVQPRDPTDRAEADARSDAGVDRRIRCAQCRIGDCGSAAAITADGIGRRRGHGRRPHPRSPGSVLGGAGRIGGRATMGRRYQQRSAGTPHSGSRPQIGPGGVAAVARTPDRLDVFWVGPDGWVGSHLVGDAHANNGAWNTGVRDRARQIGRAVTAVAPHPRSPGCVLGRAADEIGGQQLVGRSRHNGAWNTASRSPPLDRPRRGHGRRPHPRSSGCVLGGAGTDRWAATGGTLTPTTAPGTPRSRTSTPLNRPRAGSRPWPGTPDRLDVFWVGAGRIGWQQLVGRSRQQRSLERRADSRSPPPNPPRAGSRPSPAPPIIWMWSGSGWTDRWAATRGTSTPTTAAGTPRSRSPRPNRPRAGSRPSPAPPIIWMCSGSGWTGSVERRDWWDTQANDGTWNIPFERFGPYVIASAPMLRQRFRRLAWVAGGYRRSRRRYSVSHIG